MLFILFYLFLSLLRNLATLFLDYDFVETDDKVILTVGKALVAVVWEKKINEKGDEKADRITV